MALEYVGTFELTNSQLDRHSQRIMTKGVNIEQFKSNPVMFWNHMRSAPGFFGEGDKNSPLPIGRWDNIKVLAKSIRADAFIDMEDEFAAEIARKVQLGIINAVSVGVKVLSVSDDPKDKLPGQKYETILTSELREASLTDIPANASTLRLKTDLSKSLEAHTEKDEELFVVKTAYKSPDAENIEAEADDNHKQLNETEMSKSNKFLDLVNSVFKTSYSNEDDAQKHIDENGLPSKEKEVEVKADTEVIDETKTETAVEEKSVPTEENLTDEPANEAQAEKSDGISEEDFEAFKGEVKDSIASLTSELKEAVKGLSEAIKTVSDAAESKAVEVEETKSETAKELEELKQLLNERKSLKSGAKKTSQEAPVIETKTDNDDEKAVKSAGSFIQDYLGGKVVTKK